MIYVLRPTASNGARALAEALKGKKVSRIPRRLTKQDLLICWGATAIGFPCQVLNGAVPLRSKLTDARILRDAKVPTIELSDRPQAGYVGRLVDHVGGNDLLKPPKNPDFWVKQEVFVKEFRVHSFKGVSIRAGIKAPRDGFILPPDGVLQPGFLHPWVRSWDGGWRILYDGVSVKQRHRDVAHAAIAALGLDFGAVDIGQRKDKSLVVLEVNRAPGIEGGSIGAYAKAIQGWMNAKG